MLLDELDELDELLDEFAVHLAYSVRFAVTGVSKL